jgi:cell division protein FtsL
MVSAVSDGPSAASDFLGDHFAAGSLGTEMQPVVDVAVGEPPFGGFVVGSTSGALAADAYPELESPEIEGPEVERPAHLHVAPNVKRGVLYRRRRTQLVVLGVAIISAASMFTLVTFHVFAAQSAFTLDKLDSQLANEQRQYGILRDQVATLSSPEAIAGRATHLGMIRAPKVVLLHPFAASSFDPTADLPVPPPTPYSAVDNTGQ